MTAPLLSRLPRALQDAVLGAALVGYLGVLSGTSIGAGWRLAAHLAAEHTASVHGDEGGVHTHDGIAHTHAPEPEAPAPVVIPTLDPQWIAAPGSVPAPVAEGEGEANAGWTDATPDVWHGVETPPPQNPV